ncbi:hypothetical protein PENSPDRAFT_691505 [Peniophora sp. CONT]|nr:hypothetical protein PENSPDRAFT_691505 [Peniophora sp. CONT]
MSLQSNEQLLHDRVNLTRLVRRLDKTVAVPDWDKENVLDAQIKTQGMLQKVKFARKLLGNVEVYDDMDESGKYRAQHAELRRTLERIEQAVVAADQRATKPLSRPPPILPTIPLPPPSARGLEPISVPKTAGANGETTSLPSEVDLLLGATEDAIPPAATAEASAPEPEPTLDPVSPTFLPSRPKPAPNPSESISEKPALLQNSAAVHEELTSELARMAAQLKANATYFSGALEKDKIALEGAEEKITSNLDAMTKERVRLRDHRGKSMGTTCLTVTSIVVVLVSFVIMFFIIRFTRR